MEKRATAKLMALKGLKGYGNKKIIDLLVNIKNLDRVYSSFLNKSSIKEEDLIRYEKILSFCEDNKIKIISYFDDIYPLKLKMISSPPLILFAKGNLELLKKLSISIVGNRESSKKSLDWTYASSKKLADSGYVIISGGAKGIDSAAHQGALDSTGNTICVLGSGLNNIYPEENLSLVNEMANKGLVISEYLPEMHITDFSFLERNRITSGLGDKLLLVTAKSEGGAMSQFKVALSQKKEVFCPHPDLKLEPTEGIVKIIKENIKIKIIHKINEILKSNNLNQKLVLEHI